MIFHSRGTVLKMGTSTIGQLTSISGVSVTAETVETTTLDDLYKKFEGALIDGGEIGCEGFFDPDLASQHLIFEKIGQTQTVEIVFPISVGAKWQITVVVTNFETTVELGETIKFKASMKVSGQPVLVMTGV